MEIHEQGEGQERAYELQGPHGKLIEGVSEDGTPWYGQQFESPSWLAEWYLDKVLPIFGS